MTRSRSYDVLADASICSPTKCGRVRRAVVDTGSQVTLVPYDVAKAAGLDLPTTPTGTSIRTASGDVVQGAKTRASIQIRGAKRVQIDVSVPQRGNETLIGMDYLRAARCVIDAPRRRLRCAIRHRRR